MSEQTELVDDKIQDEGKQTFKTAAFEGPLDLLLFLIQKSEINIYDIPISQITEQFLDYLKNVKEGELDLNAMSDFYKMAADLIYIKSRMLLPVEVDYDEEYEDPRQELVDRLLDYQKFKKYTELLTGGATDGQIYVERKKADFLIPFDDQELFEGVDLSLLREAFLQLMAKKNMSKVFNVYETVTVNEKLTLMMELFETKEKITLLDIIVFPDKIMHIICSFMAILEGCKFRMIRIKQEKPFDTIYIWKKKSDTLSDEEADEIESVIRARKAKLVAAEKLEEDKYKAASTLALKKAEAEGDKLKVLAGLSPLEQAKIHKETAIGVARALAGPKGIVFPKIVVSGGESNDSGNGALQTIQLKMLNDLAKSMSTNN